MIYDIFCNGSYVSTVYSIKDVIEYIDVNCLTIEKEYCDENTVYIFTCMNEE